MSKEQEKEFLSIIKKPILTDKTTKLLEKNQYCFEVNQKVNKTRVKHAIEYIFNVKVIKINTCHKPHKKRKVGRFQGYRTHHKKAVVTLSKNDTIHLFSDQ